MRELFGVFRCLTTIMRLYIFINESGCMEAASGPPESKPVGVVRSRARMKTHETIEDYHIAFVSSRHIQISTLLAVIIYLFAYFIKCTYVFYNVVYIISTLFRTNIHHLDGENV